MIRRVISHLPNFTRGNGGTAAGCPTAAGAIVAVVAVYWRKRRRECVSVRGFISGPRKRDIRIYCCRNRSKRLREGSDDCAVAPIPTAPEHSAVVDLELFVGDEQNRDVRLGGSSMFHRQSFREPDKSVGPVGALVSL